MFYVYTLTDPRDGLVFYVGKGKKNRIDHHEAEARRGVYSRKCDQIRAIWESGAQVTKAKVFRTTDEMAAFAHEIALIQSIGLQNLTNVLPGGQGRAPPPKKKTYGIRDLRRDVEHVRRFIRWIDNPRYDTLYKGESLKPAFRSVVEATRAAVGSATFREIVGFDFADAA